MKLTPSVKPVEQTEAYCRSSKKAQKRAAKGSLGGLAAVRLQANSAGMLLQVDKNGQVRITDSSQGTMAWSQANVH